MGAQIGILAADHSLLQVGPGTVQGVSTGPACGARVLAIDSAVPALIWGDPITGARWQANATFQYAEPGPHGQLWANSAGALYFRISGAVYLVQARPYTPVSLRLDFTLSDGNPFGSSQSTLTLTRDGQPFTVPPNTALRLTGLTVGMTSYDYAGPPSYAWNLTANAAVHGGINGASFSGTPDAPLASYASGAQVGVFFDYNNITTHGAYVSGSGVLVPA